MVGVVAGGTGGRRPGGTGLDSQAIRQIQPGRNSLRALRSAFGSMNISAVPLKACVPIPVQAAGPPAASAPALGVRSRVLILLAVPVATLVAWAAHLVVARNEPSVNPQFYSVFLGLILGLSALAAVGQSFWPGLRRWMMHLG